MPNEKKVRIKLEYCRWKQVNYDESEPEIQEGVLIFTEVAFCKIEPPSFMIDSNEIIEVKLQDGTEAIEIILTGEEDVGKVNIVAQDVFLEVRV